MKPSDEKDYYQKAQDWEADRQGQLQRSERRAWRVAMLATGVAAVAVVALATLAPLRRTVPYVFEVDRATGNVAFVQAADDRTTRGYQEIVDKHWAQRYVLARESYVYKLLQTDYDTTLGLSDDRTARGYAQLFEGDNARDKRFGTNTEQTVDVHSIALAPDNIGSKAVVRFSKTTRHLDSGLVEPPQTYVATLAYEYVPSMSGREKDLINNPLGFRVTSYRVDPEAQSVRADPVGEY
ncbi:virB8 family protein [Asticcacaulis sp. W401b]|uniref:virB8 family protein n=1 Tax=Asticcacaulis sp. W401b TaxID=3388666 RepID=UPI003970ACA0